MTNAKEYLKNGNAKFDLKKYEEAIEDYNKAIELDSNDIAAYHNRGNSKFCLKHYVEAIEDYDEAIKLDPNAETYHNRGKAKFELKQYEEAIVDFNRAIAIAIALNIPCAKTFNIRASARAELIFAQIEEFLRL